MAGRVRQGCPPGQLLPVHHGLHRWAAPRKKKTTMFAPSSPALVDRLVACKVSALPVLSYVGSLAAPDQATVTDESRALQRLAAGPYDAIPTKVASGSPYAGFTESALLQDSSSQPTRTHFQKDWRNFRQPAAACSPHSMRPQQTGTAPSSIAPWHSLRRQRTILCAGWISPGRKLFLPAHKLQIAACGMQLGP